MERLLLAFGIVVVVAIVAFVMRRRRDDAPTQVQYSAPQQLDRADFVGDTDWVLVAFSSATCHTCADMVSKAMVMASPSLSVQEVEFGANRALHRRYAIDAVPTLVLADRQGVVHRSFIGRVTATDLWAAVAEARDAAEA
ncbi:MAG: thioredoxin family protein [Actinomycetota bacterium]